MPSYRLSGIIRESLIRQAEEVKGRRVSVALSGGVDSCSVLAALMEVGIRPEIVSYTPSTHLSTDFAMAEDTASNLGLNFHEADVSMEAKDLEAGVREIIGMGFTRKVEIESLVPMLKIAEVASEVSDIMFTGDQSDGYFALSRFTSMRVRNDEDSRAIDEIRREYFAKDKACTSQISQICARHDLETAYPYRDPELLKAFLGTTWREVNKPRIKEPIKLAFEDWFSKDKILVRNTQVNLHKGDSQFSNMIGEILMAQEHLRGPWTSPVGLYNAIARGEV